MPIAGPAAGSGGPSLPALSGSMAPNDGEERSKEFIDFLISRCGLVQEGAPPLKAQVISNLDWSDVFSIFCAAGNGIHATTHYFDCIAMNLDKL